MVKKNKLVTAYCCFKRALFLDAFRWDFHTHIALLFMKKQKYKYFNKDSSQLLYIFKVLLNSIKTLFCLIYWEYV